MSKTYAAQKKERKHRLLVVSLFTIFFLVLLLMSGVHVGLIVLINEKHCSEFIQIIVPLVYWAVIAAGLTAYTAWRVKTTYEVPMKIMAKATAKVSSGDFSVYIPPQHTSDKTDYLDVMFMDFNKMVEALGSIETLKTDFFSNVSHEIKTPLAVIQNTAELLKTEPLTDTQREYADTIYQSSKRLSGLITNILKLNKLEKQTILPDKQTYDLCAQLAECALRFESVWEEKNIEFEADIEDSAEITADYELMEIVWNNLLSNAFKFTEPGGAVKLSEKTEENEICVIVSDTGCGMDEETAKHIFDKFYQGDSSHSTEGNGLGLALAMRVLELMSCAISVKSEINKGTEFTVHIPIESEGTDSE
ncbi:MAG: ATP-binding protein [Candidatus Ornithomonoglobus sp.]